MGGEYDFYFPVDRSVVETFVERANEFTFARLLGLNNNYQSTESYSAAYLMSEINLGRRLTFIPGMNFVDD